MSCIWVIADIRITKCGENLVSANHHFTIVIVADAFVSSLTYYATWRSASVRLLRIRIHILSVIQWNPTCPILISSIGYSDVNIAWTFKSAGNLIV